MTDPNLGPSVVAAREFLTCIHKQTELILRSLDAQLAPHGWVPSNANVTNGVGPALNHEQWLVEYLYRFYVRAGGSNTKGQLFGFVVTFDLPPGFDQPVCLGVVARYPAPPTHSEIWNSWWDTHPTFQMLAVTDGVQPLRSETYAEFLPGAEAVSGLVLPLCSFTDADDLRTRLIEPLLAAERELNEPAHDRQP